jgi:endonuclease/exonuclease/phosphatase (EEP) superfamily protein YafD
MNSKLRILYTNIRSLNANYDGLLLALQNSSEMEYDVIALSESWISEEQMQLYSLSGYKMFVQARNDGRRSGGVILYVRESINIIQNEIIKIHTANILCLTLELGSTTHERVNSIDDNTLTILLCYRDCVISRSKFLRTFEPIINRNRNKNIILLGDLNINLLNSVEAADYLNVIESAGFKSIQNQPTRDRSCLDHVFLKSNKLTAKSWLSDFRVSDHAMVLIEIDKHDINGGMTDGLSEEVKIVNEKKFVDKLQKADWSWIDKFNNPSNDNVTDVNIMFQKLFGLIQDCREKATKIVKYKRNKLRQPWATKELAALAAEKSAMYTSHRANPNNNILKENFKSISARVKREIRRAKTDYYSGLLDKNLDNPKRYWEIVNGVRGINSRQNITEIKIGEGTVLVNQNSEKVAEEFNSYFNQVPVKLLADNGFDINEATCQMDVDSLAAQEQGGREGSNLKQFQLVLADVEKVVLNMKNKRSCGYDGISAYVIKQLPKLFTKILTPVFNKSLRLGIFPAVLKIATIVPVFKSGERNRVGNYRHSSLLSSISKIFENCVQEKLNNYLEHIKFYAPQQFGFLKNKSTDMALFEHIAQITNSVENNKATVAVYLDLAKAFDTVNHRVLIQKLNKAGIGGPLLWWFASYLKGRKHRVKIGDALSGDLGLEFGVPQGSVLGPLLFIAYINDLFLLPLKASIIGYADDTSLLYSAETKEDILSQFAQDWELLLPWFRENYLHLNTDKCKCLAYAYKMPGWVDLFELRVDGRVIEKIDEMKYLGLILDGKLTWKKHSFYLQTKLRKINFLFYHLKKYFRTFHLKKLYTTLYESVLSYGIIHWGACKHLMPTKVLQNKVCQGILGHSWGTSEAAIYSEMKVARLEELHKIRLALFVFKNKWLFRLHITGLQTRAGGTPVAAHVAWRKEHSRIQARYQGYQVFNNLPPECRQERRLSTYKRLLKNFIAPFLLL